MGAIVLLGPQRLKRTLRGFVDDAGVRGPVAAITAGWQEREEEIDELTAHLGRDVVNLRLYARTEDVLEHDLELFVAHRERTATLIQLQELYRVRLSHAKAAAREIFRRTGDRELLEPEREAAVDEIRRIDEHHLARVAEVDAAFHERWPAAERDRVRHHRAEIARVLERCDAVAVAGGHVGVLRNRLRLFDLASAVGERALFAWSAGAMCLAERVVLFHDSPPQGAGDAEVLGTGLGLAQGVLPFPHARRRLRLHDPNRVALLARRFAPLDCLALDAGSHRVADASGEVRSLRARRLRADGEVEELLPEAEAA
jgi:hypothetical protein